jgi:hypothetical protein
MKQRVTMPSQDTVLGGRPVRDGRPHYSCNTDGHKRLMYSLNICELAVAVHIRRVILYRVAIYSTLRKSDIC